MARSRPVFASRAGVHLALVLALYELGCVVVASGQIAPVQPAIPPNFRASWRYSCPLYAYSVLQQGWLGISDVSQLMWRIDSTLPELNRTEVFERFSNGSYVKGALWYLTANSILGPAPGPSAAELSSSQLSAPSFNRVCSPNVTEVGIDGLKLDWLSNFATNYIGIEIVDSIPCQHWNLLLFDACYDMWLAGEASMTLYGCCLLCACSPSFSSFVHGGGTRFLAEFMCYLSLSVQIHRHHTPYGSRCPTSPPPTTPSCAAIC